MILRMAFRNLSRRKVRSIIAVVGIAISVGLFLSISIVSSSATKTLVDTYTQYIGDFDFIITGTGKNLYFNSTNISQLLTNFEEISSIGPRLVFAGLLMKNDSYARVLIIGINLTMEEKIGKIELVEGNLSLKKGECLLLDQSARRLNVTPGEVIDAYHYNASGEIVHSCFNVTGIINQTGKLPIDFTAVAFISLDYAQQIFGLEDVANMVFVKLDPAFVDYSSIDNAIKNSIEIAEKIQDILGFDFQITLVKTQVLEWLGQGIENQKSLLDIFASLSLFIAIILIVSIMLMNLPDRVREVGILRSLGMSRFQVFRVFFLESILLGVLGSMIGLLLSNIFTSFLAPNFALLGRMATEITLPTLNNILLVLFLGIITSILGGIYPSIIASRITPAEALLPAARRSIELEKVFRKIKPEAPNLALILSGLSSFISLSIFITILPIVASSGDFLTVFLLQFVILNLLLMSIIFIFSGAFPVIIRGITKIFWFIKRIELYLASGNLIRYKRRAILTFFMVSLSVSALLVIGFIVNNQKYLLDKSIKVSLGSDIVIYAQETIPINATENITKSIGVESVCPVSYPITAKVGDIVFYDSFSMNIYGIEPLAYVNSSYIANFVSNALTTFSQLEENMTVVVSSGLAERLSVKIGDFIRVNVLNKNFKLKIVGILSLAPGFSFTRFEQRVPRTDILVSFNTLKSLGGNINFASKFFVNIKGLPTVAINSLQQNVGADYDIQIVSTSDVVDQSKKGIEQFNNQISLLLSTAILIAVLGLIASIVASIQERIWEIGIMRALGASRSQIRWIFIIETLLLLLISYLVGFISSFIVAAEVIWTNNITNELLAPIILPYDYLANSLILLLIPGLIFSAILSHNYASKEIVETLRRATED
ncbi:MAG: FtsX-like permease family protein [Candidatus Njordarchaeum guaymaensis]